MYSIPNSAKAPYEASYNKPYISRVWMVYADNMCICIRWHIIWVIRVPIFGIDFDFDICDRLYKEKSVYVCIYNMYIGTKKE